MSLFHKALEQAERDRFRREHGREQDAGTAALRPAPVQPLAEPEAAVVAEPPPPDPVAHESGPGVDPHLVTLLEPASAIAEQYRTLAHLVEEHRRTSSASVVAVTSAIVGDGKTTTAINLAAALAEAAGARVLLLDFDLRRPALAGNLGLDDGWPGVLDAILQPGLPLAHLARRPPTFGFDVVPAGRPSPSPFELFKSAALAALLDEARARYNHVVVDVPPLIPIPDCRAIDKLVDAFLIVVGADRTPRKALEDALGVLDPSKVLGLVFNGDRHQGSRYAGRYGSSYGYGCVPERPRSRITLPLLRRWR